jgi:hypothetical protein
MPELPAPPLSSSIGHFRAEVDRRADALGHRRRRTIGGGAVAIALVALATSSILVAGGGSTPPQTSSSTAGRVLAPIEGGRAGGVPAGTAGTLGGAANGGAANGPSDTYFIIDRPSGYVGTGVLTGMNVTVLLPAPGTGRWGRALVTKGRGSVLTFSGQSVDGAGGVQVTYTAHRLGTATIAVPIRGDPAGSWQATIMVTGKSAPTCSPQGVCH